MVDHANAMLAYARLARLSSERHQSLGCQRFLILTAVAACRAGWLDVAERCRSMVIEQNKRHVLNHTPSIADALRDPNNTRFFELLDRFCSFEQAEFLLQENQQVLRDVSDSTPANIAALNDLNRIAPAR